MCGIIGIIGEKETKSFLLHGLELLSTRGYDGCGICFLGQSPIKTGLKQLQQLKKKVSPVLEGNTGIAHNRWATHGKANQVNAHPHKMGKITIVHNGKIDNFKQLEKKLRENNYVFKSKTDSEVFAGLVNYHYETGQDFFESVYKAILELSETSTFAFLIMNDDYPENIILARRASPILWEQNNGVVYIASQPDVFHGYTKTYNEVPDGHIMQLGKQGIVKNKNFSDNVIKNSKVYTLDENIARLPKTERYWMYQELKSAATVITDAISHRATVDGVIHLGGFKDKIIQRRLSLTKKIFIAGCGTSYHAAQLTAIALEEMVGISAEAIIASEYIYRTTVFDPETTVLLVVSQSGETTDVVKLIEEWKPRGILVLGIVNVPDTQIPRLTDAGIYCGIGREVAVASTKAFLGQITCGILFTLWMGQQRGMSVQKRKEYIDELISIPKKVKFVFKQELLIKKLAKKYKDASSFFYLGRLYHAVVAAEGALKLKEISYIHAEAYPSGEMKHGALALVQDNFPSFVIALDDSLFEATMNNVSEIKARGGKVILVTDKKMLHEKVDDLILVPKSNGIFSTLLTVITTQMFAYYVCLELGHDPDQPRNLAKSVTVE